MSVAKPASWVLAALVLGASGCHGCWCSNFATALTDAPTDAEIEAFAKRRLDEDEGLCGVPVKALAKVELEVVAKVTSSGKVHVTGEAVLPAEAGVDPKKALVCAGVVAFMLTPDLDGKGKRVGWKLTKFDLEAVETDGVDFHPEHHHKKHHHH